MNSGQTAERVHDALKRRILDREFLPGERLDPAVLSQALMSSVTPVRDALNILTGQGLVETRTGEGFHLPHVTEPDLRDLYEWNAEILGLALRQRHRSRLPRLSHSHDTADAIAARTATLFACVAGASTNAEHAQAVASASDRLHVARLVERRVLANVMAELDQIGDALARGAVGDLRRLIAAYHRRRQHAAAGIVRAIYRDQ